MSILMPPSPLVWDETKPSVFLAGTIDMGNSIDWQAFIGNKLSDLGIIVLNPRRTDWNSAWEQSIENTQFREQVEWELNALEKATWIFFHFEAASKSPITLMELGLHARGGKCVVHCPKEFWRKGNIDVVCHRFAIPQVASLEEGLLFLKEKLL